MTNDQAILVTLAFIAALAIVVGIAVFCVAVSYEIRDRLHKRQRRGTVDWQQVTLAHRHRRGF